MSEDEAYRVIERSKPQMGANYLIADGIVYCVMMWAMGGVAYREKTGPSDPNYESEYLTAANDPHTLYKERTA